MKNFSRAELEHAVKLDTVALGVIRNGFVALAEDRVVMPPILSMDFAENNGEVDVKTAYIEGVPQFAIKVSPGFFDNPKLGLPSLNGLMILFSSQTGLIEALLQDKGDGKSARALMPEHWRQKISESGNQNRWYYWSRSIRFATSPEPECRIRRSRFMRLNKQRS